MSRDYSAEDQPEVEKVYALRRIADSLEHIEEMLERLTTILAMKEAKE